MVLCGYTIKDVVIRPQFVVIRLAVLPMRQHLTSKTQEWLCVHDRGYTSHIVFMRGYILHVYREGPRTT